MGYQQLLRICLNAMRDEMGMTEEQIIEKIKEILKGEN